MGVKLTIQLEGPVGPDDKDILVGATMILMALTNQVTPPEEEKEEPEQPSDEVVDAFVAILTSMPDVPASCGVEGDDGKVCLGPVGHRGRHLFRKPIVNTGGVTGGLN